MSSIYSLDRFSLPYIFIDPNPHSSVTDFSSHEKSLHLPSVHQTRLSFFQEAHMNKITMLLVILTPFLSIGFFVLAFLLRIYYIRSKQHSDVHPYDAEVRILAFKSEFNTFSQAYMTGNGPITSVQYTPNKPTTSIEAPNETNRTQQWLDTCPSLPIHSSCFV